MSFNKSKFFSRRKQPIKIDLEDDLGSLYVYPASAGEVVNGLDMLNSGDINSSVRNLEFSLKLVIACVCDENGNAVFEPAELDQLKSKPRDEIQPLISAVLKANGMSAEVEMGKEVSATDQTSTSPTS